MEPSLAEQAYEILKKEILTCVLEPGQQIVQSKLAERYQLGTTPIREALQRLAQDGLVQPIPRFGYTVSYVTLSDVHEIYELRSILEPVAARLAATRGTDQQLAEIAQVADLIHTCREGQDPVLFYVHNAGFHRSIAAAAGNRRLFDHISRVLDEMTRIFYLGLDLRNSAKEMRDEHLALAKALCDRDPDRAGQLAQAQIARSRQRILEALTHRLGILGQAVPVSPSGLS